jgi:hypothetical protein
MHIHSSTLYAHTHASTDEPLSQTHMHEHRYASSHAHRLAAPLNRLVLVARTIAGGKPKGKRRQLHSARRQTTVPSGVGYRILVIVVGGNSYVSRSIQTRVVIPITCLQGTGQAVSAPHTRTHALGLTVCMCLKVVCHALAVAGVTRRPCGLFPTLLQMSCMCVTRT